MIKMIATDVDGTLVKDGTLAINPEYYDVMEKLIEQGVRVVICSGRQYASMTKLFKPISDKLMYISDGGTVVRTPKEIIKVYPLEEEIWKGMYKEAFDMPTCDCFVATPDKCYAEDAGSRMFHWLKDSYGFPMYEVENLGKLELDQVIKFTVYNHEDCESLCMPHFIPYWQDKAGVTVAGKEWVDCIAKGSNKATAVEWLQEYWGISPEETMVFGDNLNDVEMLKRAGTSYAVANAREEVIHAAKDTCPPYWEDGVLQVLKGLLNE